MRKNTSRDNQKKEQMETEKHDFRNLSKAQVEWEVKKDQILTIGIYSFLFLVSLPLILGYGWLFLNAFSTELNYGIIPASFTLENFSFLWERPTDYYPNVWRAIANTIFLALGTTFVVIGGSTPLAYCISRVNFKGRKPLLGLALILHAFPGIILLIASYYILRTLGLLNTITGVILVQGSFFLPLGIWILKGFFDSVPWDMEMAAIVDGATRLQTLYKIVLPQVKPGIAAVSIFSFIYGWSTYIFVITFIQDRDGWTLTSYVESIVGDFQFVDYGLLAATSLVYMIPIFLFFLFTQKYLMKITFGGSKGGQ